MSLDGPATQREGHGDLVIRPALGRQLQDVALARGKRLGVPGGRALRVRATVRLQERRHLLDEHAPGRLVREKDVVAALEGDEAGPRDRAETVTALSNVVERSPIACSTIVGAVIRDRSSAMSTCWRATRLATALAGEVDIRWRSSNQRICSSVASGMNRLVKTRRNSGSSFAQPIRIMLR